MSELDQVVWENDDEDTAGAPPVVETAADIKWESDVAAEPPPPPEEAQEGLTAFLKWADDAIPDALSEFAAAFNRSLVGSTVDLPGRIVNEAFFQATGKPGPVPLASRDLPGAEGGFMEPGLAREVVQGAGGAAPAALALPQVAGRNVATIPGAAAEFSGLGSAKVPVVGVDAVTDPLAAKVRGLDSPTDALPGGPTRAATRRETAETIMEGSEDVADQKMFDPATRQIVDDPKAAEVVKQGIQPRFARMLQTAPAAAKEKYRAMLDVLDKGRKNLRSSATERMADITGDSMLNRIRVVRSANQTAGRQLDGVAKGMEGPVDAVPIGQHLQQGLEDVGVVLSRDEETGEVLLDFASSDFQDLTNIERLFKTVIKRIDGADMTDPMVLHKLKRFIDSQVTYGKTAEGLPGKAERWFKDLRAVIDNTLDNQFPEYKAVNDTYSETVEALDNLQSVAGRKMDFYGPNADKALGRLSRRLLSNAQSREPLMDSLAELERLAQKYNTPRGTAIVPYRGAGATAEGGGTVFIDDDVVGQALFINELEKRFPAQAQTSLQGDMDKVAEKAIDAATGQMTLTGAVATAGKAAYNKIRNINDDAYIEALREMLGQ